VQINFNATAPAAKYIFVFGASLPVGEIEMFTLKVAYGVFIVQDVTSLDLC
jgi:hypothetical protein